MAIKDIFKVSRKTFFDPAAWFGDAFMVNSKISWQFTRNLFMPPPPVTSETFEQAMKRLHISEEDLVEHEQRFLLFALIFLVLAGGSIIYGLYLLLSVGTVAGFALAVAMTALFLAQAFRFHFWFFQIKFRKLGCTFQEWKQGRPNDKAPPA